MALKLALEALEDYAPKVCGAAITAIKEALAEQPAQQQEPVACQHKRYSIDVHEQTGYCIDCGAEGRMKFVVVDTPPPRKPLTDEEIYKVFPAIATYTEANKGLYRSIARAIEAAHGITGETK